MDTIVAETMIRLQLEDLFPHERQSSQNTVIARRRTEFQIQWEEIEPTITGLADTCMVYSIGRAVQDDGARLVILHEEYESEKLENER